MTIYEIFPNGACTPHALDLAEQKLGLALPNGYKSFLLQSDGFQLFSSNKGRRSLVFNAFGASPDTLNLAGFTWDSDKEDFAEYARNWTAEAPPMIPLRSDVMKCCVRTPRAVWGKSRWLATENSIVRLL